MSSLKGKFAWFYDGIRDIIIGGEMLEELEDDLWEVGVTTYSEMTALDPDFLKYTVPSSELFLTREAAFNWYADRQRQACSKRSYEYQFQQDQLKAQHEQWSDNCCRPVQASEDSADE